MSMLPHTARAAARRRPFDRLERRLVKLMLKEGDLTVRPKVDELRYAISFARLTEIRTEGSHDVDVAGPLALHAQQLLDQLDRVIVKDKDLGAALRLGPQILDRTRSARASTLAHLPIPRSALEDEVTTRQLVIASGGGGGAGYVYPGAYDMIDRIGIEPALLVGTSIGALMSMFRARRRRFDLAALVAAARALSWSNVFRVLETQNRYGIPATLRLYLRNALGSLFMRDGEPMMLSDTEIPLYIVATGITVDALKHDLNYYEQLLNQDLEGSRPFARTSGLKAIQVLREFLSRRDALVEVVLGRTPGTEHFDVIDGAGFSAAIPAVIHYDILREDPRMTKLLDHLYGEFGITRLGEGGMVSNVPARIAWETATSGALGGRRNVFVVALDCFSPNISRIQWYPFQQLVRQSNVQTDIGFADLYLPFPKTLSPLNLVPSLPEAMDAIRWGREAIRPKLDFLKEMMKPLPVLRDPHDD